MQVDLPGMRALVTGGTGFLGGRLVEVLARQPGRKAPVRVLARHLARAVRIARHPVELLRGDVAERSDVERALEGCDVVFHCAYGNSGDPEEQRRATVGGTENVLAAARRHGARVVHVSTVAVHSSPATAESGREVDLDESASREPDDFYGRTKLEAEEAVLAAAREGVAGVVLRPTVIYGPFGPAWTVRILNELRTGRAILVDGGHGLCNVVYVDDVVQAMLLAAVHEEALGQALLVSGAEPITWREFYAAHERLLGRSATVELSAREARQLFERLYGRRGLLREGLSILREEVTLRRRIRATREVESVLRVARAIVPQAARQRLKGRVTGRSPEGDGVREPHGERASGGPSGNGAAADDERPIHPLPPAGIDLALARTRVRIDKARETLGYRPAYDFDAGMRRVGEWARWAGLAPDREQGASAS